ncbi:MAG: DUF3352 domain-containing protein [Chloroflexota bacterium]
MTDEREPTMDPTLDPDATGLTPSPATPSPTSVIQPTPTAPTAPLIPASRASSTPPTYEHAVAWASGPAPASPVLPPAKPRSGGRMRWAASLAVVAVVILASAVVAALITGGSSTATVLGYVPDGTTMYGEVRLDLPGDQRRAIGEFLQKFPGFADQASLETKLDEVLDDLVRNATDGGQTYTANIKPWFDGELAFSLGTLPRADSIVNNEATAMSSLRALVLISIKDPAAAQAWFDAEIAKTKVKTTSETYQGATLTVFPPSEGVIGAIALVDGKVAVAGDIASVKAAIDTKGGGGFAAQPGPKAALGAGSGDHVGFVYVGLRSLFDWSKELSNNLPRPSGAPTTTAITEAMLKAVPDWGAYWLRFERDALVMDAVAPKPAAAIGPTENRASTVVEHVPASAVVAAIGHDYGKTLKQALDLYRSDPSLKPMLDQLDGALGLVGGSDAALGWAGDVAIVVCAPDTGPEGGLVVTPTDAAAARQLFTSLRSFVALAGSQQGVTIRDETYNGTTVTIVDLGDLAKLTGMAGAASTLPVPTGHLEIAYAVTDQVVVIGSGPGFVKHVLDTTRETSLGSNARYKTLTDRAGIGTGATFVDLTAIRELVEKAAAGSASATDLAQYERDVKPFLVPFDALVGSSSVSGDMTRSTIYITVH